MRELTLVDVAINFGVSLIIGFVAVWLLFGADALACGIIAVAAVTASVNFLLDMGRGYGVKYAAGCSAGDLAGALAGGLTYLAWFT